MSFSLDGKYRSSSPAMGGLRLLPGRRRHIRLERATRYRGCDRALEPVLAHRRYAEHPIVDADALQNNGATVRAEGWGVLIAHPSADLYIQQRIGKHIRKIRGARKCLAELPICGIRSTPPNNIPSGRPTGL